MDALTKFAELPTKFVEVLTSFMHAFMKSMDALTKGNEIGFIAQRRNFQSNRRTEIKALRLWDYGTPGDSLNLPVIFAFTVLGIGTGRF